MDEVQKAIRLVKQLQYILKLGGFRLTKWTSNNQKVIEAIPPEDRHLSEVNLDLEHSLIGRALCILWNVIDEKFGSTTENKPHTRRYL